MRAPANVLSTAMHTSRQSCCGRATCAVPPLPHRPGSQRWNRWVNIAACTRFATTKNAASSGPAPVARLTPIVAAASEAASSSRQRDDRWQMNQIAPIPAAGQTRLRLVPSMIVSRPA